MQNKRQMTIETIVTLIHDNITNLFIIWIANSVFNVKLSASLKLWVLAQSINTIFSFSRRWFFNRYMDSISTE